MVGVSSSGFGGCLMLRSSTVPRNSLNRPSTIRPHSVTGCGRACYGRPALPFATPRRKALFMPLGWPELIIILVIVLLVFGPKRLPNLGRQLGGGMREFKDSISGKDKDGAGDEDAAEKEAPRPELTRAQQADVLDPEPDGTRSATGG